MKSIPNQLMASSVATLLALLTVHAEAATSFRAQLTSDQEVSPAGVTNSPETGSATLFLNGDSLEYTLTFVGDLNFEPLFAGLTAEEISANDLASDGIAGNDVTRLHIHNGDRGVNGPVVYGMFNPDQDNNDNIITSIVGNTTTISGSWDIGDGSTPLADFIPGLLAAEAGDDVPLYFNLHSVDDPAGEIRGQIFAVPEPNSLALLLVGGLGLFSARRRQQRG